MPFQIISNLFWQPEQLQPALLERSAPLSRQVVHTRKLPHNWPLGWLWIQLLKVLQDRQFAHFDLDLAKHCLCWKVEAQVVFAERGYETTNHMQSGF